MNTSTTVSYQSSDYQELQSKVTRKGQVTVPSDVRTILDLKEGDKIAFVVDKNKRVELIKKESVVAQTAGIFKSKTTPLTAKQLREEAEKAIADEAVQRTA